MGIDAKKLDLRTLWRFAEKLEAVAWGQGYVDGWDSETHNAERWESEPLLRPAYLQGVRQGRESRERQQDDLRRRWEAEADAEAKG